MRRLRRSLRPVERTMLSPRPTDRWACSCGGFHGRSGLRGAADRRLRDSRPDVAGARLTVTTEVIANILGGLIALGLLVYLFVALLRPEKF